MSTKSTSPPQKQNSLLSSSSSSSTPSPPYAILTHLPSLSTPIAPSSETPIPKKSARKKLSNNGSVASKHVSFSKMRKKGVICPLVMPMGERFELRLVASEMSGASATGTAASPISTCPQITFYTGPSLDMKPTPFSDYFEHTIIVQEDHQQQMLLNNGRSDNVSVEHLAKDFILELRVIKHLPPDVICGFLEVKSYGAFAVCSSASAKETSQSNQLILSQQSHLFLPQDEFSRLILGRKLKRKRRKVMEYEGVRVSEWVQVDDDNDSNKVAYVDNQLKDPGDGLCLFNWVSFRSTAARLMQERVEREKKHGVSKSRNKKRRRMR